MAWERFYKKDFDGALELFDAAREGHNDPSANFGRACALFRISDHEGALAELGGADQGRQQECGCLSYPSHDLWCR